MDKGSLPDIDLQQNFNQLFQHIPYESSIYIACQKLYVDGIGVFGTDGTSNQIIRSLAKHEIPFTRLKISRFFERITIAQ